MLSNWKEKLNRTLQRKKELMQVLTKIEKIV
jgi:hypothetical protein